VPSLLREPTHQQEGQEGQGQGQEQRELVSGFAGRAERQEGVAPEELVRALARTSVLRWESSLGPQEPEQEQGQPQEPEQEQGQPQEQPQEPQEPRSGRQGPQEQEWPLVPERRPCRCHPERGWASIGDGGGDLSRR
jgi:hypothetical protein